MNRKDLISAFVKIVSPLWSGYQGVKVRLFWLWVLMISYWNPENAESVAMDWYETYRERIIEYHHKGLINHVDEDSRDSLSLHLSLIEREKKDCQQSVKSLRMLSREYIKGRGLISTIKWNLQWI